MKKAFKLGTIATAIALTSGCTSMMQKKDFDGLNEQITKGDINAAVVHAEKLSGEFNTQTGEPGDLLWALQSGVLNRVAGNDKRSITYFDSAETLMRMEDSESGAEKAAETTGSILGNDAMLDYEPTQYDGVMTNYYKAMSFWTLGDTASARVEFNRSIERQRRAAQYFSEEIQDKIAAAGGDAQGNQNAANQGIAQAEQATAAKMSQWSAYEGYINPAATYASSLFFMLHGKDGADYEKAQAGFKRVYGISRSATAKADMNNVAALKSGQRLKPTVWVIYENGLSPKKKEVRYDFPLFLAGVNKVKYVGMALPEMGDGSAAFPYVQIDQYRTQPMASMSKVIQSEFKAEYPGILAREVTRAVVKAASQAVAEKQDSSGLASIIMTVATMATTGADVRSFSMLPDTFDVTSLPKQGKNQFTLKAGQFDIPVTTAAGKHAIIYVRAYHDNIAPQVSVINI